MTEYEMNITQVREEAAYKDGTKDMLRAMREIYRMDTETRTILFGRKGTLDLFYDMEPEKILDTLNHKDEIIANHVVPGDVVAKIEDPSFRDIVTFVYDNGAFDTISISSARYGRVSKGVTMKDAKFRKTGEHMNSYTFEERRPYSWE